MEEWILKITREGTMGPSLNNLRHHPSPHSPTAFSESEAETLL